MSYHPKNSGVQLNESHFPAYGITTGLLLLFLSAFPLIWRISNWNSRILWVASRSQVSISILNDDVLLEILATVKQSSTTAEREARSYANKRSSLAWRWHDVSNGNISPLSLFSTSTHSLGPLNALSSTNRHLRRLAAPDIFRTIQIGDDWN